MTWIWIILSVGITAFLLRGKNIAPHNFIWALIPIDRYGYNLAGFTVRPVYIFCLIIIAYAIITRRVRLKVPRSVFILSGFFLLILVLSMLFRGNVGIFEDVKLYGILFLNFILAAFTLSLITGRDDIRQILDVLEATAIGYGIVFISLYAADSIGITLAEVTDTGLRDRSVFMIYKNVSGGVLSEAIRLRGFYLEPNSSNMCFIAGYAVLLGRWVKNGGFIKNIICAAIMLFNIILTSSRTALIIAFIITFLAILRFVFFKTKSRRKIIFFSVILSLLLLGSIIIVYNNAIFSYIYDDLIARYTNRSALNDSMGRFSIWKETFEKLFEGKWYAGLGVNSIIKLTEAKRDAHNTIVEVMCTSGVFVGIYYTYFFISPLAFCFKRRLEDRKNAYNISTLLTAYFGIIALLFTVSNVASVYLSFFAFLLYIIPGCLAEENERINCSKDGLLNQNL